MPEVELLWSATALSNYEKLAEYLWQEWGEQITISILNRLDATIIHIKNDPEHFPIIFKSKHIRRCVFSTQTSIYFRQTKQTIEIISIFDNWQNPTKLKKLK